MYHQLQNEPLIVRFCLVYSSFENSHIDILTIRAAPFLTWYFHPSLEFIFHFTCSFQCHPLILQFALSLAYFDTHFLPRKVRHAPADSSMYTILRRHVWCLVITFPPPYPSVRKPTYNIVCCQSRGHKRCSVRSLGVDHGSVYQSYQKRVLWSSFKVGVDPMCWVQIAWIATGLPNEDGALVSEPDNKSIRGLV